MPSGRSSLRSNYKTRQDPMTHCCALHRSAITAAHFPFTLPGRTSAPIVLSAYFGKSSERRPAVSVIQAWRVAPDQYVILDQFRGRVERDELEDTLERYVELLDPAAILAASAPGGRALIHQKSPTSTRI